jgi:hypothetical protein
MGYRNHFLVIILRPPAVIDFPGPQAMRRDSCAGPNESVRDSYAGPQMLVRDICARSQVPQSDSCTGPQVLIRDSPAGISVADPNPDPSDPHVFGLPGSGSGSSSQSRILLSSSKNSEKNLDSYCFVTSF